ncbi:MAG: TlpA family protein disulfide reductase [Candidatus Rokubacteria bacterium]|nr:TlpA family protein disulfide reductase [Candidatus Rokubacteria bacterium]
MHRELGRKGLTVLAINIQEGRQKVAAWVRDRGLTSRVLLDPAGEAVAAYRVTATPTVFLIGRDGKMVARGAGTRSWLGAEGRALLGALLAAPGADPGRPAPAR